MMLTVTVAELAAFLGLSPSRVRNIIRDNGVQPQGQTWKAKLYDPRDIIRHTGTMDRLASRHAMTDTQS